jgi:alpha-tubulin suppressor-like RCC1 family protein
VGAATTCSRRFANESYCWGAGDNGELGDGGGFTSTTMTASPRRVYDFGYVTQSIAVGRDHVCALLVVSGTQSVSCWGSNTRNQFGTASAATFPESSTPQFVLGFP